MKKIILSVLLLAAISSSAFAQGKRINLYGAYAFEDKVYSSWDSYNYFDGKIMGGFQGGAGIEFLPHDEMGIELLWIGQTTTAPAYYASTSYYGYGRENYSVFDLSMNYAMIGFNQYARKSGSKLEGYGGLMLGCLFASVSNPDNGNSQSAEKFAWGFRLGGNIWASEKVAIKIQGQMLSAVQSVGGSLYFGTGGAGAGVSTYSSMLQFSLGGGLVFNLAR